MPDAAKGTTPGPWSVNDRLYIYAGRRHVASCQARPDVFAPREAEANAALIAAAPDMLAALKAARPEIVRQHDRCNSDEEVAPYDVTLALIDAAITKAEARR